MQEKPKILAFGGSLRQGSFNKKLVKIAVQGAIEAGGDVTLIDLKDYPMPIFDEDIEKAGMPEAVRSLREIFKAHDGFLISCPEYNSSMSGVFKNTIDWMSRPVPNEPKLACFNKKAGALMSASPGGFGGVRGLVHARAVLSHLNVLLITEQVTVSKADQAFNANGMLNDDKQNAEVKKLGAAVVDLIKKIHD